MTVIQFPFSDKTAVTADLARFRHVPSEYAPRVNELWQRRDPKLNLFDAPIVSVVRRTPEQVTGEFVDFRLWYACRQDPELSLILDVHPLGITGLTTWRGMVLVGKRSDALSSYPGFFECCPSGSVDRRAVGEDGVIDLKKMLLTELLEETGISHESVSSIQIKGLYLSTDTGVFDAAGFIELDPNKAQPLCRPRSGEYDELQWLQKDQWAGQKWVPLSLRLLEECS